MIDNSQKAFMESLKKEYPELWKRANEFCRTDENNNFPETVTTVCKWIIESKKPALKTNYPTQTTLK